MLALYSITLFVSAALLFMVQPMFARMVLPMLGGSPAVWNTAMVFYQAALLAAYGYAHAVTRSLPPRRYAWFHLGLMLLPFLVLPLALPANWAPPTDGSPLPWLLAVLAMAVGLPFFVVATTGPLLQSWFAQSGHPTAKDPYFLYAASNAGSMIGLLSYPLVVEPHLHLGAQKTLWTAGYATLFALTAASALALRRSATAPAAAAQGAAPIRSLGAAQRQDDDEAAPSWRRRALWVVYAFVPSSMMLGVTEHLSTDVTAMPLLWVIPLTLYLASFVLVFARRPPLPRALMLRLMPVIALMLALTICGDVRSPLAFGLAMPLIALFVIAMVCHGALAADRPASAHLTEFYLWMAVGGVLGGAFNALVAPLVFSSILEYPLALALACIVMPPREPLAPNRRASVLDVAIPLGLAVLGLVALRLVEVRVGTLGRVHYYAVAAVLAFVLLRMARRPLRFGLGVLVMVLAFRSEPGSGSTLLRERTFFGVHRVMKDAKTSFHLLYHGSTQHGVQDPARRHVPLSYYRRTGAASQVFETLRPDSARVAVIGLGAGSLAAYGRAGDQWTFYEIDPVVARIAGTPELFSYMKDSPARQRVVLGDARRSLGADRDRTFDVIVLDAYTSDAIPVHLLTREAVRIYLDHLAPHGVLVFHLSSRYFDLPPVVEKLAADAGLVGLVRVDDPPPPTPEYRGIAGSTYAVVARSAADFGPLASDRRWSSLPSREDLAVWTDDYSSPFRVISWRQ